MLTLLENGSIHGFPLAEAESGGCSGLGSGWLHAVAPTPAELGHIRAAGVPPELLSHVDDPDERPRVEHASGVVLVVLACPLRRESSPGAPFVTAPLSILLLPQGVVTVASQPFPFLEPLLAAGVRRATDLRPAEFVLRVFGRVADAYLAAVREINASVEQLEDALKRSLRNEEVLGLLDFQKSLTWFATGMAANELVLERLQRVPALRLGATDEELLEDVRIEVRQAIEMVGISDNILSQMMDAFASIVSNNLNAVMKVLTSVTILLAIPTLVASLYGMNVRLPGAQFAHAFGAIVLLCVAFGGLLFVIFRRRNWL